MQILSGGRLERLLVKITLTGCVQRAHKREIWEKMLSMRHTRKREKVSGPSHRL